MKNYTEEELRPPVMDSINAVKLVESTLARTRLTFSILFISLQHFQNHQALIVEIISTSKAEDAAKLARFYVLQNEVYPKANQRKVANLNDEEYKGLLAEKRRIKDSALSAYYRLQHHLFPDTKEAQISRDKTALKTEIARTKKQLQLRDLPHSSLTTPSVILPIEPDPLLSDTDDDDDITDMNVDAVAKHIQPLLLTEELVAPIVTVEHPIATIRLAEVPVDPILLAEQPATPIFLIQSGLAVEQPLPATFQRSSSTMRTLMIPGLGLLANPSDTKFIHSFDSQSVAIDEDDRVDAEQDEVVHILSFQEQKANRLLRCKRRQSDVDDVEEFLPRNNEPDSKAKRLECVQRHLTKHEIINDELRTQIAALQKKKLRIEFIIDKVKQEIIDLSKD